MYEYVSTVTYRAAQLTVLAMSVLPLTLPTMVLVLTMALSCHTYDSGCGCCHGDDDTDGEFGR